MVRVATRGQRKKRTKRRQDHARGVQERSHSVGHQGYVPEDDVNGPPELEVPLEDAVQFAKADKADSLRSRIVRSLETVAFALQVFGVALWMVAAALLHRGHTGALIGAGITLVGYALFWVNILTDPRGRKIIRDSPVFAMSVGFMLISPTLGLVLGALTLWWIGLVVGGGVCIIALVCGVFLASEE